MTYSECVFVAFGIQHAMRMHHIFICDLSGSTNMFSRNLVKVLKDSLFTTTLSLDATVVLIWIRQV